jgi:hypothetical protein
MRTLYAPLRPDLDDFLFATVGEERDGMPLSVISALTRLGFDPWIEASRLSSLEKREAVEQLAPIIARLPGERWASSEVRKIALGLIERLPLTSAARAAPDGAPQARARPKIGPSRMFWLVCGLLAAVALASMVANGDLSFGGRGQSTPVSPIGAPVHSD